MHSSQSSCTDLTDWALIYQNLQSCELDNLSTKLKLHFKTLPHFNDFIKLYESSKADQQGTWDHNEELFLQLIVLSHNPKCIKNRFDWEKVQKLMPNHRSLSELCFKFQSFYKALLPRQPWSSFEDKTLFNIILENSSRCKKKWSTIADQYNLQCKSEILRNAKQCRERWNNKLDPQINREPWSKSEELHFLQLLLQNGRKWADISLKLSILTQFKRRTEFALKHKFKQLHKYHGMILDYVGHKSKSLNRNDFEISPRWSNQEIDMILSKLEVLQEKSKKYLARKFSFCEFLGSNMEFSLVVIKRGSFYKLQ